jgi:pyruvate,orthophosphate dikinase
VVAADPIISIRADGPDLEPARHGAKACGLQELIRRGLPVPPAFVIPIATAAAINDGDHRDELAAAVDELTGGDPERRLAVRSGAEVSLPGAFETLLDVLPEATAAAVAAVVQSAKGLRVMTIAAALGHNEVPPTAVVVQLQVDATGGEHSGAGAAASCNPVTGESGAVGSFVWGIRGDVVMAGTVPVLALTALDDRCPEAAAQLRRDLIELEVLFGRPVELEFVVVEGELWYLQLRLFDVADTGVSDFDDGVVVLAEGQAGSAGLGEGYLHVDVDAALDAVEQGEPVVLALRWTSPSDASAMVRSAAVLTQIGGRESHAAVVTRSANVPAVLSVQGMKIGSGHVVLGGERIDVGEWLIVDGTTGRVGRRGRPD